MMILAVVLSPIIVFLNILWAATLRGDTLCGVLAIIVLASYSLPSLSFICFHLYIYYTVESNRKHTVTIDILAGHL